MGDTRDQRPSEGSDKLWLEEPVVLELDMEQLVQNWERSMTRLYIVTLLI